MQSLIQPNSYSLLKKQVFSPPSDGTELNGDAKPIKPSSRKKIICRECRFEITESVLAISVNGRHEHSFFNPHGYVFQIRCFSAAKGCISTGDPSSEFSWFANCTWQVAACGRCLGHLGWKFSSDSNSFFGLIKNNIREYDK
ncbi:cereblon family protein [Maridesulfovibrio hydrothermalis]|uniref:CULT domain-containing protein n=1 Tax=Maridesulfovibrio hydrothermalis AM13 = DSM 14728 TaxID=1121451 RepID=L0R5U3_9BACT|nr:cereblon family protein [Maridesulfovibrio hydrothermalis]CCO22034.1 conserved protein of unknown function [Maridesulfovibrio hydrothermalis AM13 = DSM 14728]